MADQKTYSPHPFLYESRGLAARWQVDRVPANYYLNLLNAFEREENSLSSRYGTQFINRDPDSTPSPAANYGFSSPVTTLARLLFLTQAWRYAGTADGSLYRRAAPTIASPASNPGQFTRIYTGLSGEYFQSLNTTCYETSQAYIFIYDQNASIKDSGTFSTPQLTGIDPPTQTANALPYSPLLSLIDSFASANAYTTTNVTGWAYSSIATLSGFIGTQITDFPQFIAGSYTIPGGNTAAEAGDGASSTQTTIYSGFTSAVVAAIASLSFSLSAGITNILGPATGGGGVSLAYSTNSGASWTTFYAWTGVTPSILATTPITQSFYVSNADAVQLRVQVTANSSSTDIVQTSATVGQIGLTPSESAAFGSVTAGMLSLLTQSGSSTFVSSVIYADQYSTNLTYNSAQYEYNSTNMRTTGSTGPGVLTDYVTATDLGFNIPLDATITGVQTVLNWAGQNAGTGILTNAALFLNGSTTGTVKTPGISNPAYTSGYANTSLGGSTDLWGASLTPADVNSSSFGYGVQITTVDSGGSDRSFLHSWTVTVYYTTGGSGGASALTTVPITSIASSSFDGKKYNSLTITTATAHGVAPGVPVSVYGTSNQSANGFYIPTSLSGTTLVVSYVSVTAVSATGGQLNYYPGAIPAVCELADLYTTPYPTQFAAFGFYQQVPTTTTSFPVSAWSGSVAASTTGTIGVTADFNLSQNNQITDYDLIVLTLQVGNPNNITNIRLQFDVNGSNYTSSYYYTDISPAFYQGNIANSVSAYDATQNQILADTIGLITGQPIGSTAAQLQPSNFGSGESSWATVRIPRGNFVPVGQAGQPGLDWSNITGWQAQVTTGTGGSSTVALNGLYLQWGYGPSSFAGVGYDWRYTYFNANTGTESSPSPEQFFSQRFGYLASLTSPYYFRQAAAVTGLNPTDSQVTHLRTYRRGGQYAQNWFLDNQVPCLTDGSQFTYKDTVGDQSLAEGIPLQLDNDPPVTSTLITPIQTALAAATTGPGSSIYSTFTPQTITVADSGAEFVPEQTVLVGNSNNLEQVLVTAGGTGSFSAVLRLQHNAGEQVSSTSVPRQHPRICCLAYNNQVFVVDPVNPANVFFSKEGYPESFGPEDYIRVAAPDDIVMALINYRGTLLAATQKTWKVIVGGAQPYAQPTGAAHGLMSYAGWTLIEGRIVFQAQDGWREFSGSDGAYMTLPVEWMFRASPSTIVPKVNASEYDSVVMAYYQNQVYGSFVSSASDGYARYRLRWDDVYKRFGLDDVPATAMLWEQDINTLLVGRPFATASNGVTQYGIAQDWIGDYDDGGWSANGTSLIQLPLDLTIQTPFGDWSQPHNPKEFNVLEGDYDTQDQVISTSLFFKGEEDFSLALPDMNQGTGRSKYQFQIRPANSASDPNAAGVEAYSVSIQHKMSVLRAPILYQENLYAAVLAEQRTSFDTYWQVIEGDYLGIFPKNLYIDYNSGAQLVVNFYANGGLIPYFTDDTTLIPQTNRSTVRVQAPARKGRLWRMIITSAAPFQLWSPIRTDTKPLREGAGYVETGFNVT